MKKGKRKAKAHGRDRVHNMAAAASDTAARASTTTLKTFSPQLPTPPTAFITAEHSRTFSKWFVAASVVTVTAALLRLLFLSLKPFHHDEGVNGFF